MLFIGEAPGKDEEAEGRIFVGKTGQELDGNYLPLAGLHRHQVRIMNAIACFPTTPKGKLELNKASHRALLLSCANEHLYAEIAESEPKLLVPMGAFACRAIDPTIDLDLHHGIPRETPWGMAFPMYHPARGMHEPKKMLEIRTDWTRLKKFLGGTLRLPTDAYRVPDYEEVTRPEDVDIDPDTPLGGDTESSPSLGPYCVTYSQCAGTGRLIRASNLPVLDAFQHALNRQRAPILFHNWFYDRRIVLQMGLKLLDAMIRDTMILAFNLGNLPQGLKALAYRELGMVMQDFEDLVRPYSVPLALDYFRRAQGVDWPKPSPRMEQDSKTGEWKEKKPQGMNTKLKRFFTDLGKDPSKDPFHMWEENWAEEQPMLEQRLGPFPQMDIAHVPFEKTLYYACRDADALVRLYPVLLRMRERVRTYPQEEWRAY